MTLSETCKRDWRQRCEDFAAVCRFLADQLANEGGADKAAHSDDFRSVLWHGTRYTFTANQAACVKLLWENWERETPDVGDATVLEQAGVAQARLDAVFRVDGKQHTAWGEMIVSLSRGTHRLQAPDS